MERAWRLFREIIEGLEHIHKQNMIHRDLKPMNIFLDSRDQVKIGDFGLATTNYMALQNNDPHSGRVGTALYVAPEMMSERPTYNQKVDIYSLGIIFFEMISNFDTGMERIKTITDLRSKDIIIPDNLLSNKECRDQVQVNYYFVFVIDLPNHNL